MSQSLPRHKPAKKSTYDPSELDDLIFSPAVGSGVASHLLSKPTTVDRNSNDQSGHVSPVVEFRKPSISVVYDEETATVDITNVSTVDKSKETPVATSPQSAFWLTDSGDFVPAKKVRRIHSAQEALSDTEENVYRVLWTLSPQGKEDTDRSAQAGYDLLVRKTKLSRKTIQRTIDKLIEKEFIEIQQPADIYTRTSTTYRVLAYPTAWNRLAARNRFHVARIGPGVVFVRPND